MGQHITVERPRSPTRSCSFIFVISLVSGGADSFRFEDEPLCIVSSTMRPTEAAERSAAGSQRKQDTMPGLR